MREHYRFRKVTPKMKVEMKKLRKKGTTYKEISETFGIAFSVVQYHFDPKYREQKIKDSLKFYSKLSKEKKKEKIKKAYPKVKAYIFERYNNDEEFRKRYIGYVRNSFIKRKKIWIEKGLCSGCGRFRIEKMWKRCEKCREKSRRYMKEKR